MQCAGYSLTGSMQALLLHRDGNGRGGNGGVVVPVWRIIRIFRASSGCLQNSLVNEEYSLRYTSPCFNVLKQLSAFALSYGFPTAVMLILRTNYLCSLNILMAGILHATPGKGLGDNRPTSFGECPEIKVSEVPWSYMHK